jgi:chemotaxis protein methyltransferase CheR
MINKDYSKYNEYWRVITANTGYDFSGYSAESLNSRLEKFIIYERIGSAEELRNRINSDRLSQERLLGKLLTSHTEFFRESTFFHILRKKVLPHLATYPEINIWIAGCSTGEEAYSVAILMDELKLLSRCNIVASDINQVSLDIADRAIYPLQKAKSCSMRYFDAGGKMKFSNYYTAYYDQVVMLERLHSQIQFIRHDIAEDMPPRRFHLVLCRNVLFYMNERIQLKVISSVANNIFSYGYLAVGSNETVNFPDELNLELVDKKTNIFRKQV